MAKTSSMAWRTRYAGEWLSISGEPPAAYLPTTDDDSGDDKETTTQPRKKHKGTSVKLQMADHTVIKQVTWPHELIYMPLGQPAIYEELSAMSFINGCLAVMVVERVQTKQLMLAHL